MMGKKTGKTAIVTVAALAAAGGAALLVLGSSGAALAQAQTTATVSVASSTTITDNTSSITWATPASLPATEVSSPAVNTTVSSNDPNGWTVSVTAAGNYSGTGNNDSCGLAAGSSGAYIPFSDLLIGVNSNTTFTPYSTPNSGACLAGTDAVYTDEIQGSGAPSTATYNDYWQLTIPAGTGAGAYAATLTYSVAGS